MQQAATPPEGCTARHTQTRTSACLCRRSSATHTSPLVRHSHHAGEAQQNRRSRHGIPRVLARSVLFYRALPPLTIVILPIQTKVELIF